MEHKINLPLTEEKARTLKAGDSVYLSGVMYTARDAAHKRLVDMINNDDELPFNLIDSTIYYVGPTPAKPGNIIGSAGPTTSYRMDSYSGILMERGVRGMIGKGKRCDKVNEHIAKSKAVYFAAIGGAGALLSNCIKKCDLIAFEDLGTEAIYRLEVLDFPVTVIVDSYGNDLYTIGKNEYLNSIN